MARVHEAIGGVDADAGVAPGAYAAAVVEVDRAIRRLEAVKLRLVAGPGGPPGPGTPTPAPGWPRPRRPRAATPPER